MKLGAGTFTVFGEENEPLIWKIGQSVHADIDLRNRVTFQARGEDTPLFDRWLPKHITTYDAFQKWAGTVVQVMRKSHVRNLKKRMAKMEEGRQILLAQKADNIKNMYSGGMSAEAWVQKVSRTNELIADTEDVYRELTEELLQFDPPGFFLIIVR